MGSVVTQYFKILIPTVPKLIIESIKSMHDINQGGIGDCWFLASLSSLGTNAIIIYFTIKYIQIAKKIDEKCVDHEFI